MIDSKWLDQWGMLVGNDENPSDNAILLTVYDALLDGLLNEKIAYMKAEKIINLILAHRNKNKTYRQLPDRPNDPASHDNMTAIASILFIFSKDHPNILIRKYCENLIKEIKVIGYYWHPRDIGYYWYIKGGVFRLMSYPFYFVTLISMFFSCARQYEKRNDMLLISTTSKLLAFLRMCTLVGNSKLMKSAFSYFQMALSTHDSIVDYQKDGALVSIDTFSKCFLFYVPNKEHPIHKKAYRLFKLGA